MGGDAHAAAKSRRALRFGMSSRNEGNAGESSYDVRGGGRGGKRARPNPRGGGQQQPKFPKCAICGQKGHVAGDAACKAAAKP